MKQIFFLRHGKAAILGDNDIFRVLTNEGKSQVLEIGNQFNNSGHTIDLIISSPATRAKETTEIFYKILQSKPEILYESFLYEGYSSSELIDYINDLPEMINTVLFVGHNPNISLSVINLAKHIDISMAPAEIIGLEFDIEVWEQLESRSGEIFYAKKV